MNTSSMWYVPHSISFSVCPYKPLYGTVITHEKINRTVQYRKINDPQPQMIPRPQMIPCTVLCTLLVDCKQLSFPQSQCSKLCKLMVKRRRDWVRERKKDFFAFFSQAPPSFLHPSRVFTFYHVSKKKNKRLLAVYLVTQSIDLGVWEGGGALSLWVESHLILCFA